MAEPSSSYIPKCHSKNRHVVPELCSLEDHATFRKILREHPGKVLKCQCQNASCELKKILRAENYRRTSLHLSLKEELIRFVGGCATYDHIYEYCAQLSKAEPQVFSRLASAHGDTVLMELCLDKKIESRLLAAQALAFISLYSEEAPSLLFLRNAQNFSAFELSALSNKVSIASYLASMYLCHGEDPNTTDPLGHTILHKLARKGDECIQALTELLSLRDADNKRILRLDIVNNGGKTPFDVATACMDLFSNDSSVSYTETLNLFQRIIYEDAEEIIVASSDSIY